MLQIVSGLTDRARERAGDRPPDVRPAQSFRAVAHRKADLGDDLGVRDGARAQPFAEDRLALPALPARDPGDIMVRRIETPDAKRGAMIKESEGVRVGYRPP